MQQLSQLTLEEAMKKFLSLCVEKELRKCKDIRFRHSILRSSSRCNDHRLVWQALHVHKLKPRKWGTALVIFV